MLPQLIVVVKQRSSSIEYRQVLVKILKKSVGGRIVFGILFSILWTICDQVCDYVNAACSTITHNFFQQFFEGNYLKNIAE